MVDLVDAEEAEKENTFSKEEKKKNHPWQVHAGKNILFNIDIQCRLLVNALFIELVITSVTNV